MLLLTPVPREPPGPPGPPAPPGPPIPCTPCVDPEDVPHIGKGPLDDYGSDEFVHDRWDWVLDEMIWAFETINTDWEAQFYTPPEGEWSLENMGEVDIEGRKKMQDLIAPYVS